MAKKSKAFRLSSNSIICLQELKQLGFSEVQVVESGICIVHAIETTKRKQQYSVNIHTGEN